ncbi:MAG: hypothetical protein HKN21_15490 [Candidatus Eisenbacteria bacterium]|uniref:Tetratricopeptide repeat protein n=1 Tax=Eiseniibacteriota bacterium TaxID=2212470 RepID=A0A7Y2H3T3_UNCEI|nr:hypothetical protein [Candidatus Eisenbacteria bacterium]
MAATHSPLTGHHNEPVDVKDLEGSPSKLFQAGMVLLNKKETKQAVIAFRGAHEASPDEALYMSFLGLSMALARQNRREAIALCEKAARRQFFQSEIFYNLGRVYLIAGQREKAQIAFREGVNLDETNPDNMRALEGMGVRRSPFFRFLPRSHKLNRYAGIAMKKIAGT